MEDESTLFAEFRQRLTRAAWRMQYRNRSRINRELAIPAADRADRSEPAEQAISMIFVQQVLLAIPSYPSRTVMQKLIVDGKTEREISRELGITQQAVNKCKQRAVAALRRQMSSSAY
ncbi:TrfB-related DNA-binding protein [Cohnella rhizosphaerae]|uniref:TrfB-related DNA-binding protein n=1 Tax=Cohnella rhizosphaerae TaxID=1457232 RepID=A0A9X4QXF2_9BACL|nr:TrfB-related DNA-binding protein [Cohnella rhizosphaerae]MDG0814634.1 TrfB-related DNA-binding protein [Cohnella rhizosphaerae]